MAWLDLPLNMGVPFLLLAGSGGASLVLVKRQPSTPQKMILAVAALALLFIYALIWFHGTFPRFRYDQLMNIGWKHMIPIGMAAILANAVVGMLRGR